MASTGELTLEEMVKSIYTKVNAIDAKFEEQQKKIQSLESEVKLLKNQVYSLQNVMNKREQESKLLSLRVNGLAFYDDEKTDNSLLTKRLYDKLLHPILSAAKLNKKIDKVPTLANTIASCYRVRAHVAITGTGSPPPVIVKLVSDQVRLAILQNKRRSTPSPPAEEKDMGILRMSIMEDLTPETYKKLRELKQHERVDKAWTTNGRIRFTVTGYDRVHLVKSSFDDIDLILNDT